MLRVIMIQMQGEVTVDVAGQASSGEGEDLERVSTVDTRDNGVPSPPSSSSVSLRSSSR